MSTKEAAKALGLSPKYLRKLRSIGGGPSFVRLSTRLCMYPEESLIQWVKSKIIRSNADDRHIRYPELSEGSEGI